jgi:hypothetical protein
MLTTVKAAAMLAQLIAATRVFDPAATFLGVFTAVNDKGPKTALSDLVLPTGGLATAVALTTWSAAYDLNNGSVVVDAPPIRITPADAGHALTVMGWYLADLASGGALIEFEYLPAPVLLPDQLHTLVIVKRLVLAPTGVWDASMSWNG